MGSHSIAEFAGVSIPAWSVAGAACLAKFGIFANVAIIHVGTLSTNMGFWLRLPSFPLLSRACFFFLDEEILNTVLVQCLLA